MTLTLKVIGADYLSEYRILVKFSDATERLVDFENFLNTNLHPQFSKYKDLRHFKKFRIERGNLVWGKDWDLIFPIEQLYTGTLNI
jgi:hypothetical protein